MPRDGKTVWIVRSRSVDPSYEESMGSAVYDDRDTLYRETAPQIVYLLKMDLEEFEHTQEEEDSIQEIIDAFDAGKFQEQR